MNKYQEQFDQQKSYFQSTLKVGSIKERIKKLKQLKSWIKANEAKICEALYSDFQKGTEEVLLTEIKPIVDEINHNINNIYDWAEPKKVGASLAFLGTKSKVIYEPKGVTLIIAPWNYPFNLCVGPLVSAIAAGNTAFIKPSENTPHTADLIVKMMSELFTKEEVSVFTGDYLVSQELLKLSFDHIFFTGSPQVGKIVMKAAAENLTSVTLELGGRNPLIVDETANLKDAAQKIIWGKFLNCGQTCISINYVYVHESKAKKLEQELVKQLAIMYPKGSEDYTHVVNKNHFKRLTNLLTKSIAEGAEVLAGGESNEETNRIEPTILKNVGTDSAIFQEEIFGPILPILTYTDLDKVIQVINNIEKPLALYVFSKKNKNIKKVIKNTSAGTTCINDTTIQFAHAELPFGGVNHSGIGNAHGKYGFLEFSNIRSVLKQRVGLTSVKSIYPPYTGFKKKMIKFLTYRIS
jgi:aldehyde dehydrogenase (NAD+)